MCLLNKQLFLKHYGRKLLIVLYLLETKEKLLSLWTTLSSAGYLTALCLWKYLLFANRIVVARSNQNKQVKSYVSLKQTAFLRYLP